MSIITKGINFARTVSGLNRFREIVTILARNGLSEIIAQSGLTKNIPDFMLPESHHKDVIEARRNETWSKAIGIALRRSFEDLGPNFIKLGQILATREDLFDDDFIAEMKHLQDNVKGIPFADAKAFMKTHLDRDLSDIFADMQEEPIGKASIGLVYKAKLKNGKDVVVKIRRPGIRQLIKADSNIFTFILQRLEQRNKAFRALGLSDIAYDMLNDILDETDLSIEARNTAKLKKLLSKHDHKGNIYVPKVYLEYSNDAILVTEFIKGIPLTNKPLVEPHIVGLKEVIQETIVTILKTMFAEDFFHADLHAGNIFLLEDGRLGIIDCGLCGTLSPQNAISLIAVLDNIIAGNFEGMVHELLDVCSFDDIPDANALATELKRAISPHLGLTANQMDTPALIADILKTLRRHQMQMPKEWILVFRLIATVDGLGHIYNIEIDFFDILNRNILNFTKELYSMERMSRELYALVRSGLKTLRILPRHTRWFLKKTASNNYAVELVHLKLEQQLAPLTKAVYLLGYLLPASILLMVGIQIIPKTILENFKVATALCTALWSLAIYLIICAFKAQK